MFSQWIISELDDRGWSYNELARRSGLSSATVSTVLSGKSNPGLEFCNGVASAFGIPPENVLRRAGLLPSVPEETITARELIFHFNLLDDEDQAEILEYVRMKRRLREERERRATTSRATPEVAGA